MNMVEENVKPKSVLLACPTFGLSPDPTQWLSSFLGALNEFAMMGWKVSTYFPYRRPIVEAENSIVSVAIASGIDYILRMDDDVWGYRPGYCKKLVDANKDYISGVIFIAGFPYSRCAFKKKDPSKNLMDIYKNKLLELDEVCGEGVQPCDLTATPFTLVKTKIYEKLLTPYYEIKDGVAMDSVFCQRLLDNGIQPYAHMDVLLNHRHVTPHNRHYLYNADARALMQSGTIQRGTDLFNKLAESFGEDGMKDFLQLKGLRIEGKEV